MCDSTDERYWLKSAWGLFGPYSLTRIECMSFAGQLKKGEMIGESPDGPWSEEAKSFLLRVARAERDEFPAAKNVMGEVDASEAISRNSAPLDGGWKIPDAHAMSSNDDHSRASTLIAGTASESVDIISTRTAPPPEKRYWLENYYGGTSGPYTALEVEEMGVAGQLINGESIAESPQGPWTKLQLPARRRHVPNGAIEIARGPRPGMTDEQELILRYYIVFPFLLVTIVAVCWLAATFDPRNMSGERVSDDHIRAERTADKGSEEFKSPSILSSKRPVYESTEDKLRRVYDSQGIKYDDKMIREDSKAIEELHLEFGK